MQGEGLYPAPTKRSAADLDSEIMRIQKSTRATIPALIPLHDIIRHKFSWYYKWHLNPWASKVHGAGLIFYLGLVGYLMFSLAFNAPLTVYAASKKTWDKNSSWSEWKKDNLTDSVKVGSLSLTPKAEIKASRQVAQTLEPISPTPEPVVPAPQQISSPQETISSEQTNNQTTETTAQPETDVPTGDTTNTTNTNIDQSNSPTPDTPTTNSPTTEPAEETTTPPGEKPSLEQNEPAVEDPLTAEETQTPEETQKAVTRYHANGNAVVEYVPVKNETVDWLGASASLILNGQSIGIEYSTDNIIWDQDVLDLANSKKIYIKVTMATNDETITPYLDSLTLHYSKLPKAPSAISSKNGEMIAGRSATLGLSDFIDPDGDSHRATEWQVTQKSGDYKKPFADETIEKASKEYKVKGLKPGKYFWRARYQDTTGAWSLWSNEAVFVVGDQKDNEMAAQRTETTKTYDNKNKTYTLESYSGIIHYKESYSDKKEQWKDINPEHSVDYPDYVLYDQMPSTVKVFKNKIGYEIESRKTGDKYTVELQSMEGGTPRLSRTGSEDKIAWAEINPKSEMRNSNFTKYLPKALASDSVLEDDGNLKFEFEIGEYGVRLWKTLDGPDAPKNFSWKVTKQNGSKSSEDDLKFRDNPEAFEIVSGQERPDKQVKITAKKISGDQNSFVWQETAPKTNLKIDTDVTYYPDPDTETSSVDGYVKQTGSSSDWTVFTGGAGSSASDADASNYIFYTFKPLSNIHAELGRGIYLFDTSALPDSATISAATLSVYGSAKADGLSITPNLNVYSSNPSSSTSLTGTDFATVGSTAFSTDVTYAGWSTSSYNDFSLNASGISNITATGVSKFSLRNANYDVANNPPAPGSNGSSNLSGYYADNIDTDKDPKLAITYSSSTVENCGGDGTVEAPYLLCDVNDLQSMRYGLDKYYKLNDNIDATGFAFEPVGDGVTSFTGSLDGNSKTISNLTINQTGALVYHGLFGMVAGVSSEIKDLTLNNVNISGKVAGSIAGYVAFGLITNVHVTGSVTSTSLIHDAGAGGIVGSLHGSISQASANVTVTSAYGYTGGIVGDNSVVGLIEKTYAEGSTNNSNASGKNSGGIAGNNSATIQNCRSAVNVNTATGNGGIAGDNNGTITNSYISGTITNGGGNDGGFVAVDSSGTYTSNYWLKIPGSTNDGLSDTAAGDISGVDPKNDSQMKEHDTFVGWSFPAIWMLDEVGGATYPKLAWEAGAADTDSGVTISGNVYIAKNDSTNIGANKTIALSVNGGAPVTDETDENGAFSFTGVTVDTNQTITLFEDDETVDVTPQEATYVTQYSSGNITGIKMYTSTLVLSHETAGPMTNTLLQTADNCGDNDINYTFSGSDLTTTSQSFDLMIATGKTYRPGGKVTAMDFYIKGTFEPQANGVDVFGSWDATGGAFTSGASTVTLKTPSIGETIKTNNQSFYNLTTNAAGGWDLNSDLTVTNLFNISTGAFNSGAYTVTTKDFTQTGGSFTAPSTNMYVSGSFSHEAAAGNFASGVGTVNFNGAASSTQIISGATAFNNFVATGGNRTINFEASKTQTISGQFTITGSEGNLITLGREGGADPDQWHINPTSYDADVPTVSYVTVSNSYNDNAAEPISPTNSVNDGNNTNWFPVVVSGTAYDSRGAGKLALGAGVQLTMIVNGVFKETVETDGSGQFGFTFLPANGTKVLIYVNGNSIKASIVYASDGTSETNIDLYGDTLIARGNTTLTNGDIRTAMGAYSDENDILIGTSTSPGVQVMTGGAAGKFYDFYVWPGTTFTVQSVANSLLHARDLVIPATATYNGGDRETWVYGDFENNGNFNADTSTVRVVGHEFSDYGEPGNHEILSGGDSFYNLFVSTQYGDIRKHVPMDNLTVINDFEVGSGETDFTANSVNVTIGHDFYFYVGSTMTKILGNLTFNGTGTSDLTFSIADMTNQFTNIIVNGDPGKTLNIVNTGLSYPVYADTITINSGNTLTGGEYFHINNNWENNGTFTNAASKVTFQSASDSNIYGNNTFHSFTCTQAGKNLYFEKDKTQTISNSLTLTGSSGSNIVLNRITGVDNDRWNIDSQGTNNVSYVTVSHSENLDETYINPTNSTDGGNTINWFQYSPTVTTQDATNLTQDTATANGNITSIGTADVTTRGFEYGLTQTPTWSVSEAGTFGTGAFTASLTELEPNTTYYIRAYATNSVGTSYGDWVSFTTPVALLIQFTSASENGAEATTDKNIAVSINRTDINETTVQYAITGGTATGSGTDYTLASGTATITAGSTSANIPLTIVNDTLDEENETIVVTLSTPNNADLGANTTYTYTINDDDAEPTIQFTAASSNDSESTTSKNFAVSLSAESGKTVSVQYAITGGTATGSGTDYTLASGTATINAGGTSTNISATIVNDTLDEDNETFIITLSSPSNATLGANTAHTYTINDDDPEPTVQFAAVSSSDDESVISKNIGVSLSVISGRNATVQYAVTGGTATGGGTDYTLASGTATITAGSTSTNISFTVVDDTLDEEDETITVALSNPNNATLGTDTTHTYTINDNDSEPTVQFSAVSSSDDESVTSKNIAVSLSTASGKNVNVQYAVTSGTATGSGTDYTLASGTATINAGSTSTDINVTIVNDELDEENETITITLSNPTNATLGANTTHTYTINDNDSEPSVQFGAASSSDNESVTPKNLVVSLSAESGKTVSVQYAITGGTATASGTDYTLASGTATITAGSTSTNIALTITDDALDEENETVVVTLSNPTNATLGANTAHTYTIVDNDPAPSIQFSATSSSGSEALTSRNIQVAISAVSAKNTAVDYAVSGGTATGSGTDYTLASGTATISAGSLSTNISLLIANEILVEANETVIITLSNPSNCTLGANTTHTYTIINDDDWPTATLSVSPASISENGGTSTVTATLSSAAQAETTINLGFSGTAVADTDYSASGSSIVIPEGSSNGTITLTAINNAEDETNKTIIVDITSTTNATESGVQQRVVTIADDDSSGGGTPVTYYSIIATTSSGGTISPSGTVSVAAGSSKTFTITAGSGSYLSDVLVDGVSVGRVTSYTFAAVNTNHTISAIFVALPTSISNPTNLTGTAGNARTDLSWQNPISSFFSHITVYRSTDSLSDGEIVADNVTGTTFADTNVVNETTYYYMLKAHDSLGNVSPGTEKLALMPTNNDDREVPTNPLNLRVTNVTSSRIGLAWDESTDNVAVVGYRIYNAVSGIQVASTTSTSRVLTGLVSETTYSFFVRAYDAAGNLSGESNTVIATTLKEEVQDGGGEDGGTEDGVTQDGGGQDGGSTVQASLILGNVPDEAEIGKPLNQNVRVSAYDAGGNKVTGYRGSVYFVASDSKANIKWDAIKRYSFTEADAGIHEFAGSDFIFNTEGAQKLSVTDDKVRASAEIKVVKSAVNVTEVVSEITEVYQKSSKITKRALLENSEEVGTTVAAATATMLVTPVAMNVVVGTSSVYPHVLYWTLGLLRILGIRRRRKPWGVVFDSETGKPISFAIVKIFSKEYGRMLEQTVTDGLGRFGFLAEPGSFYLTVQKVGYIFPSHKKTNHFYENMYNGGTLEVNTLNENALNLNVGMDPENLGTTKYNLTIWLLRLNWLLRNIQIPLTIFGIAYSIIMLVRGSFNVLHVFLIALYLLIVALEIVRKFKTKSYGMVIDEKGNPLDMAIVRIFEKRTGRLIGTDVTDYQGRYKFLVKKGYYYLTVTKPGYEEYKSHAMHLDREKTLVSFDIRVRKE